MPAASPTLTLIRHGETEWSRTGRHTSVTDLDLTPVGEEAARRLRERLDPAAFDAVFSSPRKRARRTAELAGFTEYAISDDIAEWAYGDDEGRTSAEIRAERPGWTIWTGNPPGGETADQVRTRLTRFIDTTLERAAQEGWEQIAVFAHGHSLRALTLCWLGFDFWLGDHFPLDTAAICELGFYKGGRALIAWNLAH